MKTIFIAYADSKMSYSLKRIGRQACKLGIFDEVILYTPEMLPDDFRNLKLMKYSYGGGYWAWKTWIIQHTLDTHEEGDIVCYVDAGCTLHKSTEWDVYLQLMGTVDTIAFKYPPEMKIWEKFGCSSTRIKHWGKKAAIDYYDEYTGGQQWRECNKVLGGFLFFKGKNNPVLKDWTDIVVNHPEIIDDSGDINDQYPFFCNHKHDQPALTAITFKHRDTCAVMPELLEEGPKNAAVVATRIRAKRWIDCVIWYAKHYAHIVLGDSFVAKLKKIKTNK